MKQKFTIHKDTQNGELVIKEYGELDKEILSLLCQETYPEASVTAAIAGGKKDLISTLRTRNMYPPGITAEKIAEAVMSLYTSEGDQTTDVLFDDREFFEMSQSEEPEEEADEDLDTEDEDIDALIDEDIDDDYEDKKIIKDLKSSLKVADDDSADADDDNG